MTDTYGFEDQPGPGTNRHSKASRCHRCHGDKFVLVRLRSPEQTMWMEEHGIRPSKNSFHEEYAGCPDCNPVVVEYWQGTGKRFRSMDAAETRRALEQ